jgi:DnaJ-class molecular chaperone
MKDPFKIPGNCPKCKGTGINTETAALCRLCKGTGLIYIKKLTTP